MDATLETFDADGRLTDIMDRHGRLQTAFHDTRGQLTLIEDNLGGSLYFDYEGNVRQAGVTDQAVRSWT